MRARCRIFLFNFNFYYRVNSIIIIERVARVETNTLDEDGNSLIAFESQSGIRLEMYLETATLRKFLKALSGDCEFNTSRSFEIDYPNDDEDVEIEDGTITNQAPGTLDQVFVSG